MNNPNPLTASIRTVLAQGAEAPCREPTPLELAEDACDALGCVEAVMETISEVAQPAHDERGFMGLILLRASCDHARAMLFLLSKNPVDAAASALALHRAQIETFLRAVFFSRIASEAEFQDFVDEDQGPRRRTANGRWAKVSVPALAVEVQEHLAQTEGVDPGTGSLARMVANAWDPLCGMVHGGRAVHALYVDGQRQIGCSVPAEVQFQATTNAVAVVNFSLVTTLTLAGWGGQDENPALAAPMARFHKFVDRHNARLRAAGLQVMQRRVDRSAITAG